MPIVRKTLIAVLVVSLGLMLSVLSAAQVPPYGGPPYLSPQGLDQSSPTPTPTPTDEVDEDDDEKPYKSYGREVIV